MPKFIWSWWQSRLKPTFFLLVLVLGVITMSCSFGGSGSTSQMTSTPGYTLMTMPYVRGNQIVDANGHSFLLRGAQIESPFNYIKDWEKGKRPTQIISSATLNAMAHNWHMNALRLPISNWLYAKYDVEYMSELDHIVQEANATGLYVILDLHDNNKAGSPYPSKDSTLPKPEDVTFWKAIATHYKTNAMVMFDIFNEPIVHSWDRWLHGGGTSSDGATIIGFQDLVNAIRSVGARQIIVVEPGSAGGKGSGGNNGNGATTAAEEGGWATFPLDHAIQDSNIVYSLHVYSAIVLSSGQQSAKWGTLLNHYPVYYGEWAFLPNAYGDAHCRNLPTDPAQADQTVLNFLNYMDSIHASWTAWAFTPRHLVQDYNSYAPTTLDTSWICGDPTQNVGMGKIINQYLASHS